MANVSPFVGSLAVFFASVNEAPAIAPRQSGFQQFPMVFGLGFFLILRPLLPLMRFRQHVWEQ
jgi:hypothetical protein